MNYTIHICERTERGFYIVASGETNSPARQGFLSFLESQGFDVDQCGSVAVHDAHGEVDVFNLDCITSYYVFHRNGQGSARSQWYGGREFSSLVEAEEYAESLRCQAGNGVYADVSVCTNLDLDRYE